MALFSGKLMSPVAVTSLLAMLLSNLYPGFAQAPVETPPPPAEQQAPPQLLAANQLDNLVAPVALYPDPLLSQLLVAATYPLEIVEAQQWLQQNPYLRGQQLVEAAKQQNWDPSVQAMVAFPEVMTLLTRDIRWTTDLGNAFLVQQADVMSAVQRMRASARNNGRLATTPQQSVAMETQDGQTVIAIEPADPQVIYVPVYDPVYVWGPPVWGSYPVLGYVDPGFGFGFGTGVFVGGLFSGLAGCGWGWGFSWFGPSLFLNGLFFDHYGYHGYGGYGGFGHGGYGHTVWAHDPSHRLGVPYPRGGYGGHYSGNGAVARFNGQRGFNHQRGVNDRGMSGGWRSLNSGNRGASMGPQAARSFAPSGSYNNAHNYASPGRGYQSSRARSFAAPPYRGNAAGPARSNSPVSPGYSPNYGARYSSPGYSSQSYRGASSQPRYSAGNYSAPRYSAPQYSAPRSFSRPPSAQSFSRPSFSHQSFSGPSFSRPSFSHQASRPSFSYNSGSHSSGHQSSGHNSGGSSRRR